MFPRQAQSYSARLNIVIENLTKGGHPIITPENPVNTSWFHMSFRLHRLCASLYGLFQPNHIYVWWNIHNFQIIVTWLVQNWYKPPTNLYPKMEIKSSISKFLKETTGSFQDDFLDGDSYRLLFNYFGNYDKNESKWIYVEKKINFINLSVVLTLGEKAFLRIYIEDTHQNDSYKLVWLQIIIDRISGWTIEDFLRIFSRWNVYKF